MSPQTDRSPSNRDYLTDMTYQAAKANTEAIPSLGMLLLNMVCESSGQDLLLTLYLIYRYAASPHPPYSSSLFPWPR